MVNLTSEILIHYDLSYLFTLLDGSISAYSLSYFLSFFDPTQIKLCIDHSFTRRPIVYMTLLSLNHSSIKAPLVSSIPPLPSPPSSPSSLPSDTLNHKFSHNRFEKIRVFGWVLPADDVVNTILNLKMSVKIKINSEQNLPCAERRRNFLVPTTSSSPCVRARIYTCICVCLCVCFCV